MRGTAGLVVLMMVIFSATTKNGVSAQEPSRGVIFYASGRSATGTFCDTLLKNTGMQYCKQHGDRIKEAFKDSNKLTNAGKLEKCFERNRVTLVHLKPQHVGIEPNVFWPAVKRSNAAQLIILVRRHNVLARQVSSFELTHKKQKLDDEGTGSFRNILKLIKNVGVAFETDAQLAALEGLTILEFDFIDVVTDLCSATNKVKQAMREMKWAASLSLTQETCKEKIGHTSTSHKDRSLAGRVGSKSAKLITGQMVDTPYEWMLNLSMAYPPPGRGWSSPFEDARKALKLQEQEK